jgi:hypothetical protein
VFTSIRNQPEVPEVVRWVREKRAALVGTG